MSNPVSRTWKNWRAKRRPKPNVYIFDDVKRRLDTYVKLATGEISGLGIVEVHGNNLLITDIILFEQNSNPSHTALSTADIASFLTQAVMQGRPTETLKLWWHSHVNMDVFWSQEDEGTAQGLANGVWFLSIVANKRGEYLCRLDIFDPVPITLDNLKVIVIYPDDPKLDAMLQAEIDEKVTFTRHSTYATAVYPYGGAEVVEEDWEEEE